MSNLTYNKFIFAEGDGYRGVIEEINGDIIGHCEITKSSPSVIKEVLSEWERMKQYARDQGALDLYTYNANEDFCRFLGKYEVTGETIDDMGNYIKVLQFPLYEGVE